MKKHKIVINVPMDCDKCRSKALKTAAVAKGVTSVSLEGEYRDKVAVIGEGMDSYCLVKALKKKFGRANMLSMEEVKDNKKKEKEWPLPFYYYPPSVVSECQHDSNCVIM